MQIKEYKQKAKELAVGYGFKKSDISIKTDAGWIKIRITTIDIEKYKKLYKELQKLAGFRDNSDIQTDYFEYRTTVLNDGGGTYSGMLITLNNEYE